MTKVIYSTKDDVLREAKKILNKTLRDIMPEDAVKEVEMSLLNYENRRKGYLGGLVEKYVFGLEPNSRSEADFLLAGVELKTTPIKKNSKKGYVAKERLVFSMIDYENVVYETWETSSFLEKNKLILLMLYLYEMGKLLLDYEFRFIQLLDFLNDISAQDIAQIKKDWEVIVEKIRSGKAHLLSEGDTCYLGACTKSKNNRVLRDQPRAMIQAKPRAFSLKTTYLNYLIQEKLLKKDVDADSIFRGVADAKTIDEVVKQKFGVYLGKTGREISDMLGTDYSTKPKNYKRILACRILTGKNSRKIEELEKANMELKVVTLEPSGKLKESLSFPAFDYKDLVNQKWDDGITGEIADFHELLESKKFLFVVFQKIKGSKEIVLKKVMFWNFPMEDLDEAKSVFEKTVKCIEEGKYSNLPRIRDNRVAHVRPHGRDGNDKIETPQHTMEMKRCFWLNARYIQSFLQDKKIKVDR